VAATSACHAWAVGEYNNGSADRTLILRWNGTAWKAQKSPNSGGSSTYNDLNGVAAVSGNDAWAVGEYNNGTADRTLILHWNGKAWKAQKSPNGGGSSSGNFLNGVAAVSSNDAWAVGKYYNGTADRTLILHWNGKAWKAQKSPNGGGSSTGNDLFGVAAVSGNDAWAVGEYNNGTAHRTLILHWNGKAWKAQKSPNGGGSSSGNFLNGVAAVSGNDAWAVGEYYNGTAYRTLILRWNGKAWKG
jgi:hypothetical protein